MKAEIITVAKATAVAAAFIVGYLYAAALYSEDIATLKEDYARQTTAIQEEYRAKEQYAIESMRLAWEQRDAAYAKLLDVSGDVERLRDEASAAKRRLSRVTKDSCQSEREQLARCTGIIVRGAELVKRGVELSSKSAIDKDAVVALVQ